MPCNPPSFHTSTAMTQAARRLEELHDDVQRCLSGGPVPLEEAVEPSLGAALVLEVASMAQRLRVCLAGLKDAEATLADVEVNPCLDETPERWRRAHGEVVRWREELHRAQGEAFMLRNELERRARAVR